MNNTYTMVFHITGLPGGFWHPLQVQWFTRVC